MNGLAIDQLPPELWLQIIEDRLHNEPDEFKALHNLRMTRRCCDTARELLEDRLQQTHFGKIEQVIATSTEDRRSRDSNLKRFLNSISRLPREFQSSAIFRFAPTEFRTFQLARTRNKTSKKVKDLDAKSGRNRLVNMQANFHNEGQVWMVDNTEAQLLLDLVGKCYHLKIEYNDSGDVAVVRKELYDESTVEERKLERLQAPMGILSEWMVETSNKKRTQRWVVNFFTKCAKAVSALFTTSGRVASTFFMYCGRFITVSPFRDSPSH
ncbi:uncharacterized protein KY384_007365 [Bacidia gigantensis]|uniref:uncharacterized protein n=1 Tax=Bacidia gigantensis TaxID=2732470 RepID=UPI001D057A16|nr:uncharacterized protein KY384_007365 [Bacidia gigantensis]KAG8528447.1 hypothetical protein KY384_007365 [Bacidia gigantensis]